MPDREPELQATEDRQLWKVLHVRAAVVTMDLGVCMSVQMKYMNQQLVQCVGSAAFVKVIKTGNILIQTKIFCWWLRYWLNQAHVTCGPIRHMYMHRHPVKEKHATCSQFVFLMFICFVQVVSYNQATWTWIPTFDHVSPLSIMVMSGVRVLPDPLAPTRGWNIWCGTQC